MLLSLCMGLLGSWPNREYIKTERKCKVRDIIEPSTDLVLLSAVIWNKSKTYSNSSLPEMFAASDFSSLARCCLGWPPEVTLSPRSHFGVCLREVRDERPSHLIFLCVSWVPRDMHVFNYSPLAWHSPFTERGLDIWFDCFNVTLKCRTVLRI